MPEHIITFLRRLKKFSEEQGITSDLKVDKNNTVSDVLDAYDTTGGIIADIDNGISETIDKLRAYYEKTGNAKLIERLDKI